MTMLLVYFASYSNFARANPIGTSSYMHVEWWPSFLVLALFFAFLSILLNYLLSLKLRGQIKLPITKKNLYFDILSIAILLESISAALAIILFLSTGWYMILSFFIFIHLIAAVISFYNLLIYRRSKARKKVS